MSGSQALFSFKQSASGADLALLVLEIYTHTRTAVNEESLGAFEPGVCVCAGGCVGGV